MRFFVYGTLKPGEQYFRPYCEGKIVAAEYAYILGQLFALPFGYPAAIAGSDRVGGYLLTFPDETVLSALDELEGYDPNRPLDANEYQRDRVAVYRFAGNSELRNPTSELILAEAWAYFMTASRVHSVGGILLPSGWWQGSDRYF